MFDLLFLSLSSPSVYYGFDHVRVSNNAELSTKKKNNNNNQIERQIK